MLGLYKCKYMVLCYAGTPRLYLTEILLHELLVG